MAKRAIWPLLIAALTAMVADGAFTSVTSIIWPAAASMPSWQPRVFSSIWLAGLLVTVAAAACYGWQKRHER